MTKITKLSGEQLKMAMLFSGHAMEQVMRLSPNARFVRYTSADTARKIIENREVWMRKSGLMNDFREHEHGLDCVNFAIDRHKDRYRQTFDGMFPDFCQEVADRFNSWLPHMRTSTYITCIVEDDPDGAGEERWLAPFCIRMRTQ